MYKDKKIASIRRAEDDDPPEPPKVSDLKSEEDFGNLELEAGLSSRSDEARVRKMLLTEFVAKCTKSVEKWRELVK